jgi:hypothetical protein
MKYALLVILCALLFVLSHGSATTPEPRAVLSWDPDVIVENLESAPEDTVFLYVKLMDVPDIVTLSFETVWSPWNDPMGCYRAIDGAPSGSYGWLDEVCVEIVDDEDPCTSTLHFKEPPKDGSFIRLAFAKRGLRKKLSGTFCLRNAIITDASGIESYLLTPNIATILGGVDLQLPQYVSGVEPTTLMTGSETPLLVHGGHFSYPMEVFLTSTEGCRKIDVPFEIVSSSLISCSPAPAVADTGRWTLVTGNGDGFEFRWETEVTVFRPPDTAAVESPLASSARKLSLSCYPNPFSGHTQLNFNLPRAGPVKVTVHDAAGRLICVPFDGPGRSGANGVDWDGRTSRGGRAPVGVYFVTVEFLGERATAKLMIVR